VALHPDGRLALLSANRDRGAIGVALFEARVEGVGPLSLTPLPLRAAEARWAEDGDGMLIAQGGEDPALRLLRVCGDERRELWRTDDRRAARGTSLEVAGGVALLSWLEQSERRAVVDVRGAKAGADAAHGAV